MKALLAAALAAWAGLAGAGTWSFAAIGDTPYSDFERAELPRLLDAAADAGVEFVVHVGDFKHGRSRCDDAVFEDRRRLFDASRRPFVFVPGDNDWTDCARVSNGAYPPLERLARLRQLFWADDRSLGRETLALERQSADFPEHARWRRGRVLFLTLNVPGGDNHRGTADLPPAEFLQRQAALLDWIGQGFAQARQEKLAGVVLLMQAEPGFQNFNRGIPRRGYGELLQALRWAAESFPGPVLLIHGDGHNHRVDQPLRDSRGRALVNFTRLETYGYPFLGWVKVDVDDDAPALFRFEANPWPPRPPAWSAGGTR